MLETNDEMQNKLVNNPADMFVTFMEHGQPDAPTTELHSSTTAATSVAAVNHDSRTSNNPSTSAYTASRIGKFLIRLFRRKSEYMVDLPMPQRRKSLLSALFNKKNFASHAPTAWEEYVLKNLIRNYEDAKTNYDLICQEFSNTRLYYYLKVSNDLQRLHFLDEQIIKLRRAKRAQKILMACKEKISRSAGCYKKPHEFGEIIWKELYSWKHFNRKIILYAQK